MAEVPGSMPTVGNLFDDFFLLSLCNANIANFVELRKDPGEIHHTELIRHPSLQEVSDLRFVSSSRYE